MSRIQKEEKHLKREPKQTRKKQIHLIKVMSVILLIVLVIAGITIYRDYKARPGFLEKVWISERGADYIKVSWERARNVDKYVIMYDGKTVKINGQKKGAKIEGLNEDTEYEFSVRADSRKREGFDTLTAKARTKKWQHIKGKKSQMRFANRPVDLKQTAETQVTYLPGDGYTVSEDGTVVFTRPGKVIVTARTDSTSVYAPVTKKITVHVLDSVDVNADRAKLHIFYNLNKKNCECIKTIEGIKAAPYPQSFAYHDGNYIVAYIKDSKDDTQRIATFGKKRIVSTPKMDLGHANGMTIADGICYSVRGASKKCVTFDPVTKKYSSFDLSLEASGIAYDEKTGMFFTSSLAGMMAYDSNFNTVNKVGRVRHKVRYYVQDCAAYDGIMMHVVSGTDPQGANYIDFYDMINGRYLGSIKTRLNEIESIIVDEDGYLELLCYDKTTKNRIWKTPINMKKICE